MREPRRSAARTRRLLAPGTPSRAAAHGDVQQASPAGKVHTYGELGALAVEWNALAVESRNLFQTHEWLRAWQRAFGRGAPVWTVLHGPDGVVRAGACLRSLRANGVGSTANAHSGVWDVLALDEVARAELWAGIVSSGANRANRMHFRGIPQLGSSVGIARQELEHAGYRVLTVAGPESPWLALPPTWDQLQASLSPSMRSRIRRTRRTLEKRGSLTFTTVVDGAEVASELERFLALEASGWKGTRGTAIVARPSTERLYRDFAQAAARQGWMRLYMLELDGKLIAASYGCVFAGECVLLKTAFDETYGALSPGNCLLAAVIRSAIEDEHLSSCDLLGEADAFKLRWRPEMRPRITVWAYRGAALPGYMLRGRARPMMKSVRDKIRP